MPFKSGKQRRYLWANEPEIARDWTNKYGSRVRKDNGGIMNQIPFTMGYQLPDLWNQWQQHKTASNLMKEDPTTKDYHQLAAHDFMQRFPNTPNWAGKGLATGYQLASEFGKGILNPSRMSSFLSRALEESRLNRAGIEGLTPAQQDRYDSFSKTFDPTLKSMYPTDQLASLRNIIGTKFSGSAQATTPDNKIKAMRQDLRSVPGHIQRQTSFPNTAQKFANLNNRSIQSQKYNDLVSRGIIQDKSLEGYSDWGYRDEEIGKGSKFYSPYKPTFRNQLKQGWDKYGQPIVGGLMSLASGIPGIGAVMNMFNRPDPYAQNRIDMYGAYRDPGTGFMKDKFGYNVGKTLMKNRFLEPGSNSYRSYALDAMRGMEKIGRKNALNTYYGQTYGKTWDQVKKDHQKKKDPFGTPTITGADFQGDDPYGGNYGATGGNKSTGFGKSGFGRDPSDKMARGGIAGLWPR